LVSATGEQAALEEDLSNMQSSESYRLVVRRGPQPNQAYDLNKDIITLGRDITNDIVINDPEVSRHHMRMTRGAGGYTIEDLGSTNGTFVNGQRLTGARPLRNGELIGLGETVTLSYEMASAGVTAPNMPQQDRGTVPSSPSPYQPVPSTDRPPVAQPSQYSPYAPPVSEQQPVPMESAQPLGGQASVYSPPPSFSAAPASPQAPPMGGTGYDYDPYAVREEEPRNTTRWVLIGCAGLTLFCCCSSVIGLVAVDQLCLWNRLPIVYDVLRALGYTMVC
jgi:hypothetical protein